MIMVFSRSLKLYKRIVVKRGITLAALYLFLANAIYAEETENNALRIDLNNPSYIDGILTTIRGGVITGPNLRIQAQNIEYTHKIEKGQLIQKVKAHGDLIAQFNGRVYVGKYLSYNFIEKTGTLIGAKTAVIPWYVEGNQIDLYPNNHYVVTNGYLTTSETADHLWDIKAKRLDFHDKYYVSAKSVQARVGGFPVFVIPYYQANLKQFWNDSPVSYRVVWDKGQGPRFTMRYRVYANDVFDAFVRFDYRLKRGAGGALETNYCSLDGQSFLYTKNYLAYDTFYNDNHPNRMGTRYRLQGQLQHVTDSGQTELYGSWDKLSDQEFPADFHMEDFELNIQKLTRLFLKHQRQVTLLNLQMKPRINYFDSLKQELPQAYVSIHPQRIKNLGIISQSQVKAGYLDYVYADEIDHFVKDFSSWRVGARQTLYRPMKLKGITVTPLATLQGIYYSKSPDHHQIGQLIGSYGIDVEGHFGKRYQRLAHTIQPYLRYFGLTTPTVQPDNVYIFSINDGFHRIDQLRVGLQNTLYTSDRPFIPKLRLDVYGLSFFDNRVFTKTFPKAFTDLQMNFPRVSTTIKCGWNFQENVLDVGNVHVGWTINEYLAIYGELRHRSRFYWRKADYENYILDVTRPIDELLDSPLSDGRNAAILTMQMQIAPQWALRVQSHYGWGRKKQPGYSEAKIDLLGLIATSWRIRLSYMHTVRDDRFTFGISLVRK